MPVDFIVARLLCNVESHKARLSAVAAAVVAVLLSRRLSSAWLGRALPGSSAKHAIKRFDRLLGNELLAAELPLFYRAIAATFVTRTRPTILVDWTHLHGRFYALSASMALEGRSMLLFSEVHDVSQLGNPAVQANFLRHFHSILPEGTRPIVVSDAGFHGDFFRAVTSLGWDFVGRIRGTAQLCCDGVVRTKASLYNQATKCPRDFPNAGLYARNTLACRLVLVRRPRRKRRSAPTSNKEQLEYRKSARDPWLLATSLSPAGACAYSAEDIITIYARRMQIEESFRDAKSSRFGIGFNEARSGSANRLAVQLMLASFALAAALLLGLDAEARKEHRALQANSISTRRVLSLVRLGLECVSRAVHDVRAVMAKFRSTIQHLRRRIRGDP